MVCFTLVTLFIFQHKDIELSSLHEALKSKDAEVAARDDDLRQIITRHEQEIQRLASKGEINIQDEVIKLMEQKVKDVNDALASKVKVIDMLQADIGTRDRSLMSKDAQIRNLSEKVEVTGEKVKLLQHTFASSESDWKKEKEALEAKVSELTAVQSAVNENAAYVQQLQNSVRQYEAAYQQLAAQYNTLHEQFTKVTVEGAQKASAPGTEQPMEQEVAKTKSGSSKEGVVGPEDPELKTESSSKLIEELRREVEEKEKRIRELEGKLEQAVTDSTSGNAGVKADTKFIKYKSQATAKIKSLEKQIEELKQVSKKCETLWCPLKLRSKK